MNILFTEHTEEKQAHFVKESIWLSRKYLNKLENATNRKIDFKLTLAQYHELISQDVCSYSGKTFDRTVKANNPERPTIDRIDPDKGYEPGNVCLVTSHTNHQKEKLDSFSQPDEHFSDEAKLKLLRKAVYRIEKRLKAKQQ